MLEELNAEFLGFVAAKANVTYWLFYKIRGYTSGSEPIDKLYKLISNTYRKTFSYF